MKHVGQLAILLAATFLGTAAHAQDSLIVPVCDAKFGMCRYVDRTTEQEVIPPRFEDARPFSEGLASIQLNGRYGYIDNHGNIAIEPRFDFAGTFHQGRAEVVIGKGAGVIDRTGRNVIQPMFQRAVPWTKDVIVVEEGAWGAGRLGAMSDLPGLKGGDLYLQDVGFYHVDGYWVLRPGLANVRVFDGAGLLWANRRARDPYGLIASDGTWKVEPQYDYAAALSDGLAVVRQRKDGAVLTGAVDATGRLAVPLQPLAIFGWRNGWGLARESYQSGKSALLDTRGNVIGGRFFDKVERPDEGDIATVLVDGRWKGIDRAGNLVPHPRNGRAAASCPNAFRIVEIDGLIQITDVQGEPTSPHLFQPLGQRPACDKPFALSLAGKWGFAGTDGRLFADPPSFDSVYPFDGDFAVVQQDKKWGVIDTSGRFVVAPRFASYRGRRGGLFGFLMEERETWVTASDEERPAPQVEYRPAPGLLSCGHGLRLVERDGRWGIADADGQDVIAPRYRAASCFRHGIAWAVFDDQSKWCAIGPDGVRREMPPCISQYYPAYATHASPEKFHDDAFENSVLWTRAYLEFGAGKRDEPPGWIPDANAVSFSFMGGTVIKPQQPAPPPRPSPP